MEDSNPLQNAVDDFVREFKRRSFSDRHPELGKMINCRACGRRHRSTDKHESRFAIGPDGRPRIAPDPRPGIRPRRVSARTPGRHR